MILLQHEAHSYVTSVTRRGAYLYTQHRNHSMTNYQKRPCKSLSVVQAWGHKLREPYSYILWTENSMEVFGHSYWNMRAYEAALGWYAELSVFKDIP